MTEGNVSIYNPLSVAKKDQLRLTPVAIKHFKKLLMNQGHKMSFRLSVKRSGCSGFSYVVDYCDQFRPDDLQFPVDNELIVFVDLASFPILKGTCIDYVHDGLNKRLKFINPNQIAACGCGESFSIEENIKD